MSIDADLLDTAADVSFRVLRRHAVASVVVSNHAGAGPAAHASFLIERERRDVFNEIVREFISSSGIATERLLDARDAERAGRAPKTGAQGST